MYPLNKLVIIFINIYVLASNTLLIKMYEFYAIAKFNTENLSSFNSVFSKRVK